MTAFIKLENWDISDNRISAMKNSRNGNLSITSNHSNGILHIQIPSFSSRYGLDDKYKLKLKIYKDEICSFDKFHTFDDHIKNTCAEIFKSRTTHCPMVNDDWIGFDCDAKTVTILNKKGETISSSSYTEKDIAKLIPRLSRISCIVKMSYVYNQSGKFGVKKHVVQIQLLA